jgi:hypothetical protein
MGFLFDDDVVEALGDRGRREAALLWIELLGEEIESSATAMELCVGDGDPIFEGEGLLEILLDELVSEGELPPTSMVAPALLLSKFRRASSEPLDARTGGADVRGGSAEPGVRLRLTSRF